MPNYRRKYFSGGYYFFTVVTYQREAILTTPAARIILRQGWKVVSEKYPFQVIALCLLPDHLHCIWRLPEGDCDYSMRWRIIKAMFSRQWMALKPVRKSQSRSRNQKRELPVWQRRFWEHQIRDPEDLERHCSYIHYNPVKHGLTQKAIDWPWSTYRRFVRDDRFLDLSKENLDWMERVAALAE